MLCKSRVAVLSSRFFEVTFFKEPNHVSDPEERL